MAKNLRGEPFRLVRALINLGVVDGLTDGQLVERFVTRDGEAAEFAFAALVARHGPMVLRVCRAVLRDPHDAEDAFQATFLVLVRHARSIRKRDSAASWLHGVAYRTASCSKSAAARRRMHEQKAAALLPVSCAQDNQDDSAEVVNEEVNRLMEHYRTAVVLCDLEGFTQEQAAERLGWPLGTVRSRLARGRQQLRARLARRGLAPALGACGALSAAHASATIPAELAHTTVRAAARFGATGALPAGVVSVAVRELTKGGGVTMFGNGAKTAALWLLSIGIASVGAGILVGQERKDPANVPAVGQGEVTPAKAVTVEALEERIRHLERKLESLLAAQEKANRQDGKPSARRAESQPNAVRNVRLRFASLVEKVLVNEDQTVKAGDPLAELYSTDLIAAKNELLVKNVQWQRDQRLLEAREKLHKQGSISTQVFVDTQNDEAKSRLDRVLARDRLIVYGLTEEEIDAVKDEKGEQRGRFTVRAPVDGVVYRIEAQPGDLLDAKALVLTLRLRKP